MNKNILIAVGVFLVVVIVGAFTIKKPQIKNPTNSGSRSVNTTGKKVEVEIVGNEYSFTPSSMSVQAGDDVSITFKNAGASTHALFIDGYNIGTSGVAPGKSATLSFTADKTGTFNFYCTIDSHRELGMQGTLEVK